MTGCVIVAEITITGQPVERRMKLWIWIIFSRARDSVNSTKLSCKRHTRDVVDP